MAVLELRYQSPDPSGPRPAALGSTPFHSIPPPNHPEAEPPPPPPMRGNPRQTGRFRRRYCASSVPTFRRITLHPPDICIATHPQTLPLLHFTLFHPREATLIAFYIISMCFRSVAPPRRHYHQVASGERRSSKTLPAFLINPRIYRYEYGPLVGTHYRPSRY